MAWRLAKSLQVLLSEVDAYAPRRDTSYDGTIGDAAHQARASRHNPNAYGVVTALDITHDPQGGMDAHALARRLVLDPHPDLAYIISNRESASRSRGWVWRPYTGSSPHDRHIHVAVGTGPDSDPRPPYDDAIAWGVDPQGGDEDMTPEQERLLKLGRLSDLARSYDADIIKALIEGDRAKATELESAKAVAVAQERQRLGLQGG